MQQDFFKELISNLSDLSKRITKFETWEPLGRATISTYDSSNPPSEADVIAAFGTQPSGFIGLLDDNGANTNVYICMYNGTSWWYTALTKAV